MKRLAGILVIANILLFTVNAQERPARGTVDYAFTSGGLVTLKLSSGDYVVRPGRSDRIVVRWSSNKIDDMDRYVDVHVYGRNAQVRTDGPTKDGHFIIEIPPRSDIRLNIRAGDVKVTGIEGNKDIQMTAGDLDIDVEPDRYSRVEASVTFGDLTASPLGISKGGIARSFKWTGAGSYELRARLFAGDLTLH